MEAFVTEVLTEAAAAIRRIDPTLVFTVLLIIPAYWSVIISRSTAKRQLRAYVSVNMHKQGLLKDPSSGKWAINFSYQNEGTTPAYKLDIAASHTLVDGKKTHLPPPVSTPYVLGMLGPGGEIFDTEVTELSDTDVEALAAGKRYLYFYGVIRYFDAFKRRRFTTFRFFTGGPEPFKGEIDPDMTLCSEGNDAN